MPILANSSDIYLLIPVIVIAVIIVAPFLVFRAVRKNRAAAIKDAQVAPGQVRLVFHTYSGFLVYVTMRTYDVVVPVDQAGAILKGWFRHNLTWGFFAYGGLFIPILSYFEYRAQSKKIALARQRGFPVIQA